MNVGYLTEVSWRNVSISKGDDLMDNAEIEELEIDLKTSIDIDITFVRYGRQFN
jgi:hypothetical protein